MTEYNCRIEVRRIASEAHSTYEVKTTGSAPVMLLIPMSALQEKTLEAARNSGTSVTLDVKINLPEFK